MIERLNQITLNDFIELSCGNYACLLSDRGSVSESTLKEMEKQKYEEIRASIEQNKELVHDTKNHYLVISEYVKNQEYEKLEN